MIRPDSWSVTVVTSFLAARTAWRSPRRAHLDHQRAILDSRARDQQVLYSQKLFQ
jgi:hypothetical protein